MDFNLQPFLENNLIKLRPLHQEDFKGLFKVASDSIIWEQHQNKDRYTQEAFTKFFDGTLLSRAAFIIIENRTDRSIGSSRFSLINELESVIEMGWSFLSRQYWAASTTCGVKKLMVNYALKYFGGVILHINSFVSIKTYIIFILSSDRMKVT